MKNNSSIFGMAKKHLNPDLKTANRITVPIIIAGTVIALTGTVIDSKKILMLGSIMSIGNLLFLKCRTK